MAPATATSGPIGLVKGSVEAGFKGLRNLGRLNLGLPPRRLGCRGVKGLCGPNRLKAASNFGDASLATSGLAGVAIHAKSRQRRKR